MMSYHVRTRTRRGVWKRAWGGQFKLFNYSDSAWPELKHCHKSELVEGAARSFCGAKSVKLAILQETYREVAPSCRRLPARLRPVASVVLSRPSNRRKTVWTCLKWERDTRCIVPGISKRPPVGHWIVFLMHHKPEWLGCLVYVNGWRWMWWTCLRKVSLGSEGPCFGEDGSSKYTVSRSKRVLRGTTVKLRPTLCSCFNHLSRVQSWVCWNCSIQSVYNRWNELTWLFSLDCVPRVSACRPLWLCADKQRWCGIMCRQLGEQTGWVRVCIVAQVVALTDKAGEMLFGRPENGATMTRSRV